jgi:hypothetical protein
MNESGIREEETKFLFHKATLRLHYRAPNSTGYE